MKNKSYLIILFIIIIISFGGNCFSADTEIILCGGSATGNSKVIVSAIGKILTENAPNIRGSGAVCPGFDTESVMLTHKGVMHGGVGTPIVLEKAVKGEKPFPDEGVDIKFWFFHNQLPMNFLALSKSGITHISELKGHKVGLAPPGTSNYIIAAEIVFPAHGIELEDIDVQYMNTSEAINKLKDGHIDAMAHTRAYSGAVLELTMNRDITLLQPDIDKMKMVVEEYPWIAPEEWPLDYPKLNVPDPGLALIIPEFMYLSGKLKDNVVYEMTKAVFENVEVIHNSSKVFDDVSLETALSKVPIEPHPGAIQYYKEMNVPKWEKYQHLIQ